MLIILIDEIGSVTKFLAGSTSKRIPYEIVYCLRLALSSWTTRNALITTAISSDFRSGFYFQGVSPNFNNLTEAYLGVKLEQQLVQISLPQLYRHRPLYNIPLFHELGHFLDTHHKLTDVTLILHDQNTALPSVDVKSLTNADLNFIQQRHRMEYFADLFAASYVGMSFHSFLKSFAPANGVTLTHPATQDRLDLIEKFLSGVSDPIIQMFNQALKALNLPELKINYTKPNVEDCFNNFRPYFIASDAELHGIFDASWTYLERVIAKPDGFWENLSEDQIEKIINNLVEKSIRNYMVVGRWDNEPINA